MGEPITREAMTGAEPVPGLLQLGELLGELRRDAEEAHQAMKEGKPRGPITGLPQLDKHLGGRLAPGLNVIHGGPGIGKTAFALQLAATCGVPALYVSVEMAPLELLRRIIARHTTTSLDFIRAGSLSPEQIMEKAQSAIAALPSLAILDATETYASTKVLEAAAMWVRGNDQRHVLVIVDSIHSWVDSCPSEADEYTALNSGVAALRVLGRRLDIPVVGIAERNRSSMKGGGVSASAGTRKFEFGAEAMLELDQEEGAARNGAGEVPVKLKIPKNRNGQKGQTVNLLWHDAYQRFREVPQ